MAKSVPDASVYKMTAEQAAARALYKDLMEEVKIRLDVINMVGTNKTGLPGPIAREVCFLQLRMLCELIALGCLVAHGDISGTQKLVEEWHAGTIVKKLEQLHADFFPTAVTVERRPDPEPNHLQKVTKGVLTKDELVKLYGICGDSLHRGSLKKLLSPKSLPTLHLNDIQEWGNKIGELLHSHAILTLDRKTLFACVLWNISENRNVSVQIGTPIPGDGQHYGTAEHA